MSDPGSLVGLASGEEEAVGFVFPEPHLHEVGVLKFDADGRVIMFTLLHETSGAVINQAIRARLCYHFRNAIYDRSQPCTGALCLLHGNAIADQQLFAIPAGWL
ncbi:hypothetical protein JFV30_27440 [Pseudomonas sp. TH32]|uniref:hypothetical protein n=1 Tax=Pseudomonas sp. TH32 TaxID=2796397 RepID=UPI00191155BB|nr:hypothetical protein [Pseudomonas sp. TH32]MBK5440422.1 hypothetical protein [Pseudomonas sp. TH32]